MADERQMQQAMFDACEEQTKKRGVNYKPTNKIRTGEDGEQYAELQDPRLGYSSIWVNITKKIKNSK